MQGRSQRPDLSFLRFGLLAGSAHCDEGILDLPEGHQDGLLVLGQGLSRLRFGRLLLEAQGLGIEERRGQGEAGTSKGTAPESGKLRTRYPEESRERDFWKALGLGDPDPGSGRG